MRPAERIERLRRCAELRLAGAPWKAYPGIGRPGVERIELFSGHRAVLALESNGARTLIRLGYGAVGRSYDATYRSVQAAAAADLKPSVEVLRRAHLLLRRHGQMVCRRVAPHCGACPVAGRCTAAISGLPIGDPFATSGRPNPDR
jgi:A/G-specific adenine glycosylase